MVLFPAWVNCLCLATSISGFLVELVKYHLPSVRYHYPDYPADVDALLVLASAKTSYLSLLPKPIRMEVLEGVTELNQVLNRSTISRRETLSDVWRRREFPRGLSPLLCCVASVLFGAAIPVHAFLFQAIPFGWRWLHKEMKPFIVYLLLHHTSFTEQYQSTSAPYDAL